MELRGALREAIETQVLEHEPAQAALVLRRAVESMPAGEVAAGLLDVAAAALRRMVVETDEALPRDELLERLALDGAVGTDQIELLGLLLTIAAATAGGIRPPVADLESDLGAERLLFGAWLATLASFRIVAYALERTEAELVDELLTAMDED